MNLVADSTMALVVETLLEVLPSSISISQSLIDQLYKDITENAVKVLYRTLTFGFIS